MGEVTFVLKGKSPQSWVIGQQNIMAEKPDGSGLKFINYYKGQDSIFTEDIKNKDIKPSKVPDFVFNISTNRTELSVPDNDKNLTTYLKTHPWYGKLFEITSASIEAKREIDLYEKKEEAIAAVNEISDNVKAAAVAVLGFEYYTMDGEQCRAALKKEAFNNPVKVLSIINSPTFESRKVAALALSNGIIKTSVGGTEIQWEDGGVILSLAIGENAIDKLSIFISEATPASEGLYDEIAKRLKLEKKKDRINNHANQVISEKDAEIERLKALLAEKENTPAAPALSEDATLEELQAAYEAKHNREVPSRFKNDKSWIAGELKK